VKTTSILRHINVIRCLRILGSTGALSRSDLARELDLTRTTVGHAVSALLEAGLVWEPAEAAESTKVGRPGVGVALNPAGAFFVGLDISTSSLTAALIDFAMKVRAKFVVPLRPDFHDVEAVVDQLADLTQQAIRAAGKHCDRVEGIGVSVPGLVARDGRVVVLPLLEWRDIDLRGLLAAKLGNGHEIRICNDAVALARAVCSSATESETRDLLLVLMAEGIGSAIVRQGRVVEGFNGYAGEIGQMRMGPRLGDGSAQTFQDLAGYRAFSRFLATDVPAAEAIASLAAQAHDSSEFVKALDAWAAALAAGLLNVTRLLDQERIVIGGALAALYPRVSQRVDALLKAEFAGLTPPTISVARCGAEGAAVGAAAMIRESFFDLPELAQQDDAPA
jgi:predicted NBD/HSP70 family sugar kinase